VNERKRRLIERTHVFLRAIERGVVLCGALNAALVTRALATFPEWLQSARA
jgi:hypothetical protein